MPAPIEYHALARLSEDPEHTLRMSTLAELTNASLSRLSHLVKRLEARGLVRREPDPTDGRVRALVIDCLSAEELAQLRAISERLHSGLAPRSD